MTELLLNLAWLLLALPAYLLWRDARNACGERKFTALQCLLTLGCMLVILFPVVSATDDLCAMRAEMEESPCSKRSIGHSGTERPSASKSQTQPALVASPDLSVAIEVGWHFVVSVPLSAPASSPIFRPVRAPPISFVG